MTAAVESTRLEKTLNKSFSESGVTLLVRQFSLELEEALLAAEQQGADSVVCDTISFELMSPHVKGECQETGLFRSDSTPDGTYYRLSTLSTTHAILSCVAVEGRLLRSIFEVCPLEFEYSSFQPAAKYLIERKRKKNPMMSAMTKMLKFCKKCDQDDLLNIHSG